MGSLIAWLPVNTTRALRRLYTPVSPGHANNKHGAQFALQPCGQFLGCNRKRCGLGRCWCRPLALWSVPWLMSYAVTWVADGDDEGSIAMPVRASAGSKSCGQRLVTGPRLLFSC
jgi:hypothetical protein